MNQSRSAARGVSIVLLVLAAWTSFFGLLAGMSIALSPPGGIAPSSLLEIDLGVGVLWAALSWGIDAWHRRARAVASSAFGLIVLHIPPFLVATLLDSLIARWLINVTTGTPPSVPFLATVVYYADFDIVSYLVVVAVSEALIMHRAALSREQLANRLEALLGRARLDYLEAQLQPHFLFNSLGAVSELAFDAPATAERVLQHLIAIFRTALATKSDEITLGEELVGIEPYLDIQRVRFADWLTIEYTIDGAAVDCVLPRFVLQPLIENAIRHGLSGRSAAGVIEISAVVRGGELVVRVVDNGVGLQASSPASGRGIGLANVRNRLSILYGDDNRLRLMSNSTGGAIAEFTIPARRRANASARISSDATALPVATDAGARPLHVPELLRRPTIAIPLIWLFVGLLWTQQGFFTLVIRSQLGSDTWLSIAANNLISAGIWALLTPAVLWGARRYPLRRAHLWRTSVAYLVAGFTTTFVHAALEQQLTARDVALVSANWVTAFVIGFVIFLILAAIGHREAFGDWRRSREAATESLSAELADAQRRATALQSIPAVLLQALEGIAATAKQDASLTERQLARLADYLRLALESSDARGLTAERQRALDTALAALRDVGAYSPTLTRSA